MTGASNEEITMAEETLGLQFADDYRQYLAVPGVASFDGHELTGICNSKRLDVVTVTVNERPVNCTVQPDWYVLEQTGIDSITIWQSSSGEVYLCRGVRTPVKIADSLIDYLNE
jgi:hypothetical protein